MHTELATEKTVICAAICNTHSSCSLHITKIRTTYDNKVNQVAVLRSRVHPGGLVSVLELKHGVSDILRKL